jgi:hypothetical protein
LRRYLIGPDGEVLKYARVHPTPNCITASGFWSLITLNPFSFYPPEVDPYRLRDKIVSVIPYVYGR